MQDAGELEHKEAGRRAEKITVRKRVEGLGTQERSYYGHDHGVLKLWKWFKTEHAKEKFKNI